jgi:hypothetical protein
MEAYQSKALEFVGGAELSAVTRMVGQENSPLQDIILRVPTQGLREK